MRRVSNREPCRVCGHTSWCCYDVREGATTVLCMRVEEGSYGTFTSRIGRGYKHHFDEGDPSRHAPRSDDDTPRAPLTRRAAVYYDLLTRLELDEPDRRDLVRRGLSDDDIAELGYRSLREDVAEEMARAGVDLRGVPGFWREGARWSTLRVPGYLIPIRDRTGRIQACQIRRRGGGYIWLSSVPREGREDGAGSGAPVHVRPRGRGRTRWVCESPLKADYVWRRMGVPTIGIAGVWTAHDAVRDLVVTLPTDRVTIAFDGDWRENRWVAEALITLASSIVEDAALAVDVAVWSSPGGIDDALAAGLSIAVWPADRWVAAHEDPLRALIGDDAQFDHMTRALRARPYERRAS